MDQITVNVTEIVENVTVQVSVSPVLPRYESWLQEDITNSLNGVWFHVIALTLQPGVYSITARVQLREIITYSLACAVKIATAGGTLAIGRLLLNADNGYNGITLHCFAGIATEQPVTVYAKVSGINYQTAVVCADVTDETLVKKVTGIQAMKIG